MFTNRQVTNDPSYFELIFPRKMKGLTSQSLKMKRDVNHKKRKKKHTLNNSELISSVYRNANSKYGHKIFFYMLQESLKEHLQSSLKINQVRHSRFSENKILKKSCDCQNSSSMTFGGTFQMLKEALYRPPCANVFPKTAVGETLWPVNQICTAEHAGGKIVGF